MLNVLRQALVFEEEQKTEEEERVKLQQKHRWDFFLPSLKWCDSLAGLKAFSNCILGSRLFSCPICKKTASVLGCCQKSTTVSLTPARKLKLTHLVLLTAACPDLLCHKSD